MDGEPGSALSMCPVRNVFLVLRETRPHGGYKALTDSASFSDGRVEGFMRSRPYPLDLKWTVDARV